MEASVQGHKDVVDVLLKHGVDLNQQNVDGDTALMFAYKGRNQVKGLEWLPSLHDIDALGSCCSHLPWYRGIKFENSVMKCL